MTEQRQAMGQLVRKAWWDFVGCTGIPSSFQEAAAMDRAIAEEWALLPGGATIHYDGQTLYVNGATIGVPPQDRSDYIVQWNGTDWATAEDWKPHVSCFYCGNDEISARAVSCPSCNAPTAYWWTYLDALLANWKWGLAG